MLMPHCDGLTIAGNGAGADILGQERGRVRTVVGDRLKLRGLSALVAEIAHTSAHLRRFIEVLTRTELLSYGY